MNSNELLAIDRSDYGTQPGAAPVFGDTAVNPLVLVVDTDGRQIAVRESERWRWA